jgi:hypothetical protein
MENPIKIIHKFKNNNRRIQYKIFIFKQILSANIESKDTLSQLATRTIRPI